MTVRPPSSASDPTGGPATKATRGGDGRVLLGRLHVLRRRVSAAARDGQPVVVERPAPHDLSRCRSTKSSVAACVSANPTTARHRPELPALSPHGQEWVSGNSEGGTGVRNASCKPGQLDHEVGRGQYVRRHRRTVPSGPASSPPSAPLARPPARHCNLHGWRVVRVGGQQRLHERRTVASGTLLRCAGSVPDVPPIPELASARARPSSATTD